MIDLISVLTPLVKHPNPMAVPRFTDHVMHDDELEISDELVRRLIDRDAPELGDRPLRRLTASGSTNALFGLGADHLVRLPRQPGGSATIETEARWLPHLASTLPVPVPEVVAVGHPGFGYPERWAITTWINGAPPRRHLRARVRQRTRWSATWRHSLQRCMPPTYQRKPSPIRPCTPTALGPVDIDAEIRHYIEDCQVLPGLPFDIDACAAVWTEAVALPVPSKDARHWVHSDLLAENLLVLGDRLAAVLDFGALSVGDPSVDLIIAWEVLGPAARQVFRSSLSVDDVTWQRGRGWALAIAVMTFPYYWTSMPSRCSARLAMARQVLADRA